MLVIQYQQILLRQDERFIDPFNVVIGRHLVRTNLKELLGQYLAVMVGIQIEEHPLDLAPGAHLGVSGVVALMMLYYCSVLKQLSRRLAGGGVRVTVRAGGDDTWCLVVAPTQQIARQVIDTIRTEIQATVGNFSEFDTEEFQTGSLQHLFCKHRVEVTRISSTRFRVETVAHVPAMLTWYLSPLSERNTLELFSVDCVRNVPTTLKHCIPYLLYLYERIHNLVRRDDVTVRCKIQQRMADYYPVSRVSIRAQSALEKYRRRWTEQFNRHYPTRAIIRVLAQRGSLRFVRNSATRFTIITPRELRHVIYDVLTINFTPGEADVVERILEELVILQELVTGDQDV
jgi:hypothetical protein